MGNVKAIASHMRKLDKFMVWFWYGRKYIPYFEKREEYERYNVCRRRK